MDFDDCFSGRAFVFLGRTSIQTVNITALMSMFEHLSG
jgi:hypothetical protein